MHTEDSPRVNLANIIYNREDYFQRITSISNDKGLCEGFDRRLAEWNQREWQRHLVL